MRRLSRKKKILAALLTAFTTFNFVSYFFYVNDSGRVTKISRVDGEKGHHHPPVQLANPWVDSSKKRDSFGIDGHDDDEEDILQKEQFHSEEIVDGCVIRAFTNHSVYSKPEFAEEYRKYQTCRLQQQQGVSDGLWTEDKIEAYVGKMGEIKVATKFRFSFDEDLANFCKVEEAAEEPPKVIYFVFSAADQVERRSRIRRTWAEAGQRNSHRVVFFLGGDDLDRVRQEAETFGDILASEFSAEEEKENFEVKQIAAMFAFTHENCELARFVVKTTDATFVNVKRVSLLIRQEEYAANRIYGELLTRMMPDRNAEAGHYIAKEVWPWPFFPPFLKGPSFVVSGDVVLRLLIAAKFAPPIHLEQIFFTGLAPLVNRIMRIGVAEFFKADPDDEGYDEEDLDECFYARHGMIDNVTEEGKMELIHRHVDKIQSGRNATCTVKPSCWARVEGKCIWFASKDDDDKMKTKKKKSKKKKIL